MSKAFQVFRDLLTGCCPALFLSTALADPNELQTFAGCEYVPTPWADGDSFLVRFPDGEEHVLRLYYVDCIETSATDDSDKRRLREQARYFGVEDPRTVVEFGKEATERTAELLSRPFTVSTAFANALGRSAKPRFYAFIKTAAGKDLSHVLVEEGLARSHGMGRETPAGISRDEYFAYLDDAELVSAIKRKGVWKHSDPDSIAAMRAEERKEIRELEGFGTDDASLPPLDAPVDLNAASEDELIRAGIPARLVDAVMEQRDYETLEQLMEVKGIGPVTLEKVKPNLLIAPPSLP